MILGNKIGPAYKKDAIPISLHSRSTSAATSSKNPLKSLPPGGSNQVWGLQKDGRRGAEKRREGKSWGSKKVTNQRGGEKSSDFIDSFRDRRIKPWQEKGIEEKGCTA
ncbi:hypothetical protein CDAR_230131 [Caerostris darwini]|uniref:Uncharacterized protein n=1 Tax=Caerostris darwini TaxID=1538125 RepID=A0AAV4U150_9ARAC|nr:hypothetical protein CDAR_230131 [Caerostris darwini]